MTISNCECAFVSPFNPSENLMHLFKSSANMLTLTIPTFLCSSQFDPAPRDESWHKSPRTPDYFL